MAFDPINDWLPEIAAQFDGVSTLIYARPAGDQDLGGHWHPSVEKHKKMAVELGRVVTRMLEYYGVLWHKLNA